MDLTEKLGKGRRWLRNAGLGALLLTLAACGGSGSGSPAENNEENPESPGTEESQPTPDVDYKNDLKDIHVVLEEEANSSEVGEDYIVFPHTVNFDEGDIIATGISDKTPYGFLRAVTSVDSDLRTVNTRDASLEEAIDNGEVNFSGTLSPEGISTTSNYESSPLATGFLFNMPIAVNIQGLNVTGSFGFDSSFDLRMLFNGGLEKLTFENTTSQNLTLTLNAGSYLGKIDKEIVVAEYPLTPIQIPTPVGFPLVIVPNIKVLVNAKGNAAEMDFYVFEAFDTSAAIVYQNGRWGVGASGNSMFNFSNPSFTVFSDIRIAGKVGLELLIYGGPGPSALGEGFVEYQSTFSPRTLYAGLAADIGISTGIFSSLINNQPSKRILEKRKLLYEESTNSTPPPEEPPEEPEPDPEPTEGTIRDSRDGKTYKTVKIGNQQWMAENLNYDSNGQKKCYDDEESNCNVYGGLYTWNAAKESCPSGWHLPQRSEFDDLSFYLGSPAGGKMKSTSSLWEPPNEGATNESGFSAFPGGNLTINGDFSDIGKLGIFWTSSEYGYTSYQAWAIYLSHEFSHYSRGTPSIKERLSVRCIKDD